MKVLNAKKSINLCTIPKCINAYLVKANLCPPQVLKLKVGASESERTVCTLGCWLARKSPATRVH